MPRTQSSVAGAPLQLLFLTLILAQASFRDAVWPEGGDDQFALDIWGPATHPDWQVQQLLADVVVYYFEKSYSRFVDVSFTINSKNCLCGGFLRTESVELVGLVECIAVEARMPGAFKWRRRFGAS